jgi:transcriptional regulator with XRE-family HTH domain
MNTTAGCELKKRREAKGITLDQAARDTCLSVSVLELLESSNVPADSLPEVYQRLSCQMYARYLGVPVKTTRTPQPRPTLRPRRAPLNIVLRGFAGPASFERPAKRQPGRLFALAKATSAAIVVVLTIGLWSLNAKLSRLNIDRVLGESALPIERAKSLDEPAAPAEPPLRPVLIEVPLELGTTPLFLEETPALALPSAPAVSAAY